MVKQPHQCRDDIDSSKVVNSPKPVKDLENKYSINGHPQRKFVGKKHVHQSYELRKRTASDGSTRGSLLATHDTKPPSHVKVVNTKKIKKSTKFDTAAVDSDELDNNENPRRHDIRDQIRQPHKRKPLPRYPHSSQIENENAIINPGTFSEYESDSFNAAFPQAALNPTVGTESSLLGNYLNSNGKYGCVDKYSSIESATEMYGAESIEDNTSALQEDSNRPYESKNSIHPEITWLEDRIAYFIYDKENPEFTTKQQYFWSFMIGTLMGVLTYVWGWVIEFCVDIVWKRVPELLLTWGVFTDEHGPRPLPHYMWICPAFFGGVLSYVSARLDLPSQGTWIDSLHRIGILDWSNMIPVFLISTAAMASGLSLGPELPLVLLAGMIGSYFGVCFKQSVLSARVMNLTAASAAIGGFFGFPLTGALFVLEIPHRMGLQYYEAFSPATLASIVAVLVNQMVSPDDKEGVKFAYPPLSSDMHRNVFLIALIYGVVGRFVGVGYTLGCLRLKKWVHDLLHVHHEDNIDHNQKLAQPHDIQGAEKAPLIYDIDSQTKQIHIHTVKTSKCNWCISRWNKIVQVTKIQAEPKRAAVAGVVAGTIIGVVCMFLPHNLFWGEAQLQTLISRGEIPLPIFGNSTEPTGALVGYGYCMGSDFSTACAGIISVTKIFVIGLSLGTGIVGGHFWGPLYVGCAVSHLFVDLCSLFNEQLFSGKTGFLADISSQSGVAILCIMGSAHVVPFRAHMAIMLVLTLSIKKYTPGIFNNQDADNYLAMFPLMVVSCFVSLMTTKAAPLFYSDQRCRGDIKVIQEALCEPHLNSTSSSHINSSEDILTDDSDISMGESDESPGKNIEKQGDSGYKSYGECFVNDDAVGLDVSMRSASSLNKSHKNRHRRTRSAPFIGRIDTFTESLLEQGRVSRSRSNSISMRSRSNTPVSVRNRIISNSTTSKSQSNSNFPTSHSNTNLSMKSQPDMPLFDYQ